MRIIKKFIFSLILIAALVSAGCNNILLTPHYNIAFSTPEGEPVFVEDVIYDDRWRGRGGMLFCCWKMSKSINIIEHKPVPKKIFVRWFNYKQQKFYEATIFLPKNTPSVLRKIPKTGLGSHKLTTGVLPNGEVVVWVSGGGSELISTWVEVARVQGHEAEGDPATRKNTTEDLRKRGEI